MVNQDDLRYLSDSLCTGHPSDESPSSPPLESCRLYTSMGDRRGVWKKEPNADVGVHLHVDAFKEYVMKGLSRYGTSKSLE